MISDGTVCPGGGLFPSVDPSLNPCRYTPPHTRPPPWRPPLPLTPSISLSLCESLSSSPTPPHHTPSNSSTTGRVGWVRLAWAGVRIKESRNPRLDQLYSWLPLNSPGSAAALGTGAPSRNSLSPEAPCEHSTLILPWRRGQKGTHDGPMVLQGWGDLRT